jgi:ATP-dependent RNA helicase DDX19/DBP5
MTPPDCQVLLFSATFPPEVDKYAKEFIGKGKRSLVNLKLPSEASLMIPERKQFFMRTHTRNNGKIEILREIYEYIQSNQSIVFCNTIKAVEETQRLMTELNCPCSILHSKLPTEADRDKAIDEFRGKNLPEGVRPSKVLICTDVIARGVDIPNVNLVVNYELPFKTDRRGNKSVDYETYAHRIPRCSRAGRHGTVINFVQDAKDSESVKSIINHFSDGEPDPSLIKEWGADPDGPDGGVEGLYRDEIEEAEARVNSIAEAKKLAT